MGHALEVLAFIATCYVVIAVIVLLVMWRMR